jgi:hypothetical protein
MRRVLQESQLPLEAILNNNSSRDAGQLLVPSEETLTNLLASPGCQSLFVLGDYGKMHGFFLYHDHRSIPHAYSDLFSGSYEAIVHGRDYKGRPFPDGLIRASQERYLPYADLVCISADVKHGPEEGGLDASRLALYQALTYRMAEELHGMGYDYALGCVRVHPAPNGAHIAHQRVGWKSIGVCSKFEFDEIHPEAFADMYGEELMHALKRNAIEARGDLWTENYYLDLRLALRHPTLRAAAAQFPFLDHDGIPEIQPTRPPEADL